jgi:protein phosphatase PTC1
MQLWDVCADQIAVNLIRKIQSPEEAAEMLVKYALDHFSTDNVSVMVVRFSKPPLSPHIESVNTTMSSTTPSESPKE